MDRRQRKKEEARQAKLAEFEARKAQMIADQVDPEEIAALKFEEEPEEEDPDAPNLENKITEAKEALLEKWRTNTAKLEEYVETFKTVNINAIVIETDKPIDNVFLNICFELREYIEKRSQAIEKFQLRDITWEQLESYENSYVYKRSKFGDNMLECQWKLPKERDWVFTYRNRIYYCGSEEERKQVKENIAKVIAIEAVPKDLKLAPKIFIVGKLKAGKTSLAKLLEEKLGLVRIKIKHVLKRAVYFPCWANESEIDLVFKKGQSPSDEQIIDLLQKRLQMKDCTEQGWVLDGYPKTKNEAILLAQKGIIPDLALNLIIPDHEVIERIKRSKSENFGLDLRIVNQRLNAIERELGKMETFYIENFDCVKYLNTKISKWGMFDQARKLIIDLREKKFKLGISLISDKPCVVSGLGISTKEILTKLSDFTNYSAVALRARSIFIREHINSPYKIYYKHKIYFTSSNEETEFFLQTPERYLDSKLVALIHNAPRKLNFHELTLYSQNNNTELNGYCPVSLVKGVIINGCSHIVLNYKGKSWLFQSEGNLLEFLQNPFKYEHAKLPEKLPLDQAEVQQENLEKIKRKAESGDCTAYLEHHLGNIAMKVMAQLGNKRLKYPTLSYQETALKFMAISLKANNTNKDSSYRKKYSERLSQFIKHCNYACDIEEEAKKRDDKMSTGQWTQWEEENYLKKMEEFHEFMKVIKAEEKINYFKNFIR